MNYSNFNDNNYQEKEQDSNIFFQGNPKDKKNYKVSKTIQMILIILTFLWRWEMSFCLCYGVRKINFNIFMALENAFLSVLWRLI